MSTSEYPTVVDVVVNSKEDQHGLQYLNRMGLNTNRLSVCGLTMIESSAVICAH